MGHLDPCSMRGDEPILMGRSRVSGSQAYHLWGSVAPGAGTQETYSAIGSNAQVFHGCHFDGGLWQVTTTCNEYVRVDGEGSLSPLNDTALTVTPAGVDPGHPQSQLSLRITADDGVDKRQFEIDANQSITIVAQMVCVDWVGPSGMVDVQNLTAAQLAPLTRTGMVLDSFLGVSLSRIEATPGSNSSAVLTRTIFVPRDTRASVVVPRYAKSVTIYQEPLLGVASVMWTMTYGDPNGVSGFMTVGSLPFIPGQRRTQPGSDLPNVSHLWTDIDAANDRFFLLRYTIQP